ncbi:HIT domain-containing protein, partial [Candidatus Woesearchaeota archaeon]|nr:HIT domain-containing protein [Candidatus Woesearchaeota archaeon]
MKEDKANCIFCKITSGKSPCSIIYEDNTVLVFPPLQPVNKGHVLIVPKKHVSYLADLDEKTNVHIIK